MLTWNMIVPLNASSLQRETKKEMKKSSSQSKRFFILKMSDERNAVLIFVKASI